MEFVILVAFLTFVGAIAFMVRIAYVKGRRDERAIAMINFETLTTINNELREQLSSTRAQLARRSNN